MIYEELVALEIISKMNNSEIEGQAQKIEGEFSAPIDHEGIISFQSQIPSSLNIAMRKFIETYPNWDQYRLIQAALAGFLVQNGIDSRPITRLYIENMFSSSPS